MFDFFQNGMNGAQSPDMQNAAQNVEQVVSQYAGKSEAEMLAALQSMVNSEKAAGRLSSAKMEYIKNTLLPMLDEAQKKRMLELLSLIQ